MKTRKKHLLHNPILIILYRLVLFVRYKARPSDTFVLVARTVAAATDDIRVLSALFQYHGIGSGVHSAFIFILHQSG